MVVLGVVSSDRGAVADDRPNIILLLADDLGYGDLSCFGSPAVKTPYLDGLAEQGMKFTRFYAGSAVCSPTRASVLTGRYPLRFGITKHFNDVNRWLPEAATTVAELLRGAGYNTAHVGKWHLGGLHVNDHGKRLNDQPGPRQHGFDFYQTQIEQQPVRGRMGRERTLFRKGGTVLLRNDQRVGEDDPYFSKHLTDANGDFAIEMIESFAAEEQPFFINLWWLVPHKPYEPAPEPHWSGTAAKQISDDQHRFRSMVQHMDAKVGQILKKLDELGIAENTLVLFTSDNGAAYEGFIGELKGGKTDLHEGGIRVPMVVRWPAAIPAGKTTDAFGHTNDLLPTFCAAAGVELPDDLSIDGLSLLDHVKGGRPPSAEERGTVFWQMDLYRGLQRHYPKPKPYATEVAKRGKWKLLALRGKPVELFDVEADPYERLNVLDEHPDLVASLTVELDEWLNAPRTSDSSGTTSRPDRRRWDSARESPDG
ncbi:sulfatase family protein [Rhodopirellula sp. JC639]|uniref:sulfatase family protein n=1 Tax=Stieleria mannarensis TaxID=2755585 RepID=UPI00336AC218